MIEKEYKFEDLPESDGKDDQHEAQCSRKGCFNNPLVLRDSCWEHLADKAAWKEDFFRQAREGKDFSNACLCGADLSNMDLTSAKLNGADLEGAKLNGALLLHAELVEARLCEVSAREADFFAANLRNADLFKSDLSRATLVEANLEGVSLIEANLTEADLSMAKGMSSTRLTFAVFHDTKISPAELSGGFWEIRDGDLMGAMDILRRLEENYRRMDNAQAADDAFYLRKCFLRKSLFNRAFFKVNNLYPDQIEKGFSANFSLYKQYGKFGLVRFLKYLLCWKVWLFCGWGERPARILIWLGLAILFSGWCFGPLGMDWSTEGDKHIFSEGALTALQSVAFFDMPIYLGKWGTALFVLLRLWTIFCLIQLGIIWQRKIRR